jgi:anti-anti-sigma factor
MPAGDFNVETVHEPEAVRLVLTGELDISGAEQLDRAVQDACAMGSHVEIDLAGLGFIDSSGLRALLVLHKAAATSEFTYSLIPGPPEVHRTFVLTGLDQVLAFR